MRRDHARNPRSRDALDAWAGPPDVAAGLERAVERRAPCEVPGLVQRSHLGVRPAGLLVIPLPDDRAVFAHDDRAHHRIGTGRPPAPLGEVERAVHVVEIGQHAGFQVPVPVPGSGSVRVVRYAASGTRTGTGTGTRNLHHLVSNSASTYSSTLNGMRSSIDFADADVANRQLQLAGDRDRDAALGRAVELRQHDAVHAGDVHELARLAQAVLADRRVEHEQHFVRRARHLARGDAADLLELVHQVHLRVKPPCRIDENRIAPLRLARRDPVEHHGRRIGALARANQIHAGAAQPRFPAAPPLPRETCRRRTTSGFLPDAFSSCASFPTVVVLPVPLTPTISTTCGTCPFDGQARGTAAKIARISSLTASRRLLPVAVCCLTAAMMRSVAAHADVGHDQQLFERLDAYRRRSAALCARALPSARPARRTAGRSVVWFWRALRGSDRKNPC